MRLLVAASSDRHDQDDDFDGGTIPGELVEPAFVCDRDLMYGRDHGCGCGRSFVGLTSGQATTVAVVADRPDIDPATLRGIIAGNHPDDDPEDIDGMVDDLTRYAQDYDLDAAVGIYIYRVHPR